MSGYVYADTNGDGARESTEPGLVGATIILAATSTTRQSIYYVSHTALDGSSSFGGLPAGTYAIAEQMPGGGVQTLATTTVAGQADAGSLGGTAGNRLITGIILPAGTAGTGYNFAEDATSSIGRTVFLDANQNGTDDGNEFGVANIVLTLTGTDASGQAVSMTATTDSSGHYAFDGLTMGIYQITIARPTSVFNQGHLIAGTAGGTVHGHSISGIHLVTGEDATGYKFAELMRPNCRLNTATVRALLRVGPNATSLPASVHNVSFPSNGTVAHYLPTLAALASERTTVAVEKAHGRRTVHVASNHPTPTHAAKVHVQHGVAKPNAAARRHK